MFHTHQTRPSTQFPHVVDTVHRLSRQIQVLYNHTSADTSPVQQSELQTNTPTKQNRRQLYEIEMKEKSIMFLTNIQKFNRYKQNNVTNFSSQPNELSIKYISRLNSLFHHLEICSRDMHLKLNRL